MVEAREVDGAGEGQLLLWRLLITLEVANIPWAMKTVRLYRLRLRIEGALAELKTQLRETQVVLRSKTADLVRRLDQFQHQPHP